MAKKKGAAIRYGLFSELPKEEQQRILATSTEKGRRIVTSVSYTLPITNEEYFDPKRDGLLIAFRGKEMLGSALFRKRPDGTHLDVLFVPPKYRRQGIGTKLFMRLGLLAERKWKKPLRVEQGWAMGVLRMGKRMGERPRGRPGKKLFKKTRERKPR